MTEDAQPGKSRTRGRRRYRVAGALLVAALLIPLTLMWWVVATEAGLRALVRIADRATAGQVVIANAEGRLVGPLTIGGLRVDMPDLRVRVDDFGFDWNPRRLLDRHLHIEFLSVGSVEISTRPPEEESAPLQLPPPFELPVSVSAPEVRVGRLSILPWDDESDARPDPTFEISEFSSAIESDGRLHRIENLSVTLPFGEIALTAQVDAVEPTYPLTASGSLRGAHEGHDFDLAFETGGDLRALHVSLAASGAGLNGDAEAMLAPFEAVPLRLLRIALGEIDPSAFVPDAPRAALTVRAELTSVSTTDWELAGPVHIENREPDTVDKLGIPITSISARLSWTPFATEVDDIDIRLPEDGRVAGMLRWLPGGDEDPLGRLTTALELAGIRTTAIDTRLPEATIAGRIDAQGDEVRQTGQVDVSVGEARITAEGVFEAAVVGEKAATFSASGGLSSFNPASLIPDVPSANLNLDFETDGVLGDEPVIHAFWQFRPSTFDGRAISGKGQLALEGDRVREVDLRMELAGNSITANGAWGAARDVLNFVVDAPELAGIGYGLGGKARAKGWLSGTRAEPSGEIELSAERLVLPGDVRLDALNASGQLDAGLDGPIGFALAVTGVGNMQGDTWLDTATVSGSGTRAQHRIDVGLRSPEDDSLGVRLEGALLEGTTGESGDGMRWRGRLVELDVEGRVPLTLDAPAELSASRGQVVLGAARLEAGENGRISLEETVWTPELIIVRGSLTGLQVLEQGARRRPGRGPGPLTLGGEWDLRLGARANGEARLFRESGDVAIPGELSARVGLQHLEVRLNAVDDRLALSLDANGTELGVVTGSATALAERGPEGGWRLAPDAALLGSARLDMPSISWLSRLTQEDVSLEGSVLAEFSVSGTPGDPDATGQIAGKDLAIVLLEHGIQLSGGELLAEFDRDRLRLSRFEFVSPNRVRPRDPRVQVDEFVRSPGRLSASGEIALETGEGKFTFEADRLPLLQRADRWLIMSGKGSATSTWTSLDLEATFRADAGYVEFAETPPPSLSDDVVIVGEETAPREGGLALSADVRVSLGDNLYLSALGLDTRLTGDLRLRMQPGQALSAIGTIGTSGGSFRGYGQALTIERGLINFQGPLDNPGLNVVALRKGLAVEAGISVSGSARRPVIRLVSQPNVPDPDKLSWIVLGRGPTAGGGADLGLLLPAAQALLGGPGGGMTDQLSRSLGFDEFGIGQGELGSAGRAPTSRVVGGGTMVTDEGSVSGQVLTLGKRLSTDLFLSFEQSLGGAESLVKLTYQLTRRVSVVARGGTNNSGDIYYTVSFR